ncbi:uncharacterized protein LOC118757143, partial [Rhagoletis pomonella]|uniref:uncharacterized protein LOC118757143 n=1 Tax=Rhagoletis pomonella TaxID=28610 RepID=UPI0017857572
QKGVIHNTSKEDWELATKINAVGPPVRDGNGWYKVWKDLKLKVKKKMIHNKKEARSTGGGIFNQMALAPLEETVANLMGFEELLNPAGYVYGVANEPTSPRSAATTATDCDEPILAYSRATNLAAAATNDDEAIAGPSRITNAAQPPRRKANPKEDKMKLVDVQTTALKQIKKIPEKSARYQRRQYRLAEEQRKLLKEREEETFKIDIQKKKKIEILQNQLDN